MENRSKKLLFRNVGDIWDKSEGKRVTDKRSQDIINMASCRGISFAKDGNKIIFPHQPDIEAYLDHVADFLLPGETKEKQKAYIDSVVIPAKLPVGDATSEDYLEAKNLLEPGIKAMIEGSHLEPYVDGEGAAAFAQTFGCHYESEFHKLFFKMRNKVHFHHFCEQNGLPTIPESIAAGLTGDYIQQCQNILEAILILFEKGHNRVMIRQATAAGGIGNARIDKLGQNSYHISRVEKSFDSDQALLIWIHDVFHKTSRTPGMMVAPFFPEGPSLSGTVVIRENGEVVVPYVAQEMIDSEGTSFNGVKVSNDFPEDWVRQTIDLLTRAGKALRDNGVKQGFFQIDTRMVNGQLRMVESNAMRKTAVIELVQIMTDSADWIQECKQRLNDRDQKAFIGAEHTPISDAFHSAIEKGGFHQAFNEFRILSPEQAREHFGVNAGEQPVDIGVFLHASTPPHVLDGKHHTGFIIADKAIRPKLGEKGIQPLCDPLAKLSLEEKWELMKKVFGEKS